MITRKYTQDLLSHSALDAESSIFCNIYNIIMDSPRVLGGNDKGFNYLLGKYTDIHNIYIYFYEK